jgi:hypothetical protein
MYRRVTIRHQSPSQGDSTEPASLVVPALLVPACRKYHRERFSVPTNSPADSAQAFQSGKRADVDTPRSNFPLCALLDPAGEQQSSSVKYCFVAEATAVGGFRPLRCHARQPSMMSESSTSALFEGNNPKTPKSRQLRPVSLGTL